MATDRHVFIKHLEALQEAIERTQPLAEYKGNFNAIHSIVCLSDAAEQIVKDVDGLWSTTGQERPPWTEDPSQLRAQLNANCLQRDALNFDLKRARARIDELGAFVRAFAATIEYHRASGVLQGAIFDHQASFAGDFVRAMRDAAEDAQTLLAKINGEG